MRPALLAALAATASLAGAGPAPAVGFNDDTPPTPTETTTECADGTVWNPETETCVAPDSAALDDDARFRAARELAYAGNYAAALRVLDAMHEADSDRVLTYRGFAHRRAGDTARGMAYYAAALERNPDNLLARSYMGQGLAETGDTEGARLQLSEIRSRGGRGTWAEFALRAAIGSGRGYAY